MSELLRAAILGTGQVSDASLALSGSAADGLVERLGLAERERALLLRAGSDATLRRAAKLPPKRTLDVEPAPQEAQRPTSPKLSALLAGLFDVGETAVLHEALERVARAGLRLSPELLPRALSRTAELHPTLRPLLGERGRWLARQRGVAWALQASGAEHTLPVDLEQRWVEGTAGERKALLALARALAPERARVLVTESWKQEKVDQRVAWLEVLESNLSAQDEPLLAGMLSDRSPQVRVAAARLLWRLCESEVARRVRERVNGLIELESAGNVLAKLRSTVGSRAARTLRVTLPPEKYDATWEKEGIVETPTGNGGRRQFWLTQMVASVSPAHWAARWDIAPHELVALLEGHELGDALLDGLTSAAIRHDARDWFPPLWDAWARLAEDQAEGRHRYAPQLSHYPMRELLVRMTAADAELRLLRVLEDPRKVRLLANVPGPWPEKLARLIVAGLRELRLEWTEILPTAALAIPVELLPTQGNVPPLPDENDYAARAYLRALERFQTIAALRQSVAREIAS